MARAAQRVGLDGIMVMPALVYASKPHETVAHYRGVAAATDLPLMVYNNPPIYRTDVTPDILAALADCETIVCFKESSGDTRRITVFGHSAGGASVLELLASPLARGLVHRAIAQSSGLAESLSRQAAETKGLDLASRLGAPAAAPLPALRALSPERIVSIGGGPFDRVTDGWALPEQVEAALKAEPATKGVFVQASETSTGAAHDVEDFLDIRIGHVSVKQVRH